jgi:flagellar hook-associated protein 2
MAGISVSGVGSGLDINQIVSDLIAAEKAPATLRLDNKQATLEAKLSAFGIFQGAVSEFRSALGNINTAAKFQSMTATVSNTALFTASATSIAQVGTYDIEVTQLAQAQKLVTSDTQRFSTVTDVVGTGTLSFQVGSNAAQTITIDSSNQTLEGGCATPSTRPTSAPAPALLTMDRVFD